MKAVHIRLRELGYVEGQNLSIGSNYARPMSESAFATVRHRTVRSKGCLSNKTVTGLIAEGLGACAHS
jgi:hypothetical protein